MEIKQINNELPASEIEWEETEEVKEKIYRNETYNNKPDSELKKDKKDRKINVNKNRRNETMKTELLGRSENGEESKE